MFWARRFRTTPTGSTTLASPRRTRLMRLNAKEFLDLTRRWSGRIVWNVVDQALSSGANFVMALTLARWLSVTAYGTYAVAFSIYLFALSVYTSIVTEPMSVLAHAAYAGHSRAYYGVLLRMHWLVSGGISAFVALIALLFLSSNSEFAWALMGVCFSLPFSLLFWVSRRACYLNSDTAGAAQGSLVYASCALALLFSLRSNMSSLVGYVIIGLGGLAAGLFLHARLLRTLIDDESAATAPVLTDALRRHLEFARWTLPASGATALGQFAVSPLLATTTGLAAAGMLRAAQNVTAPIVQLQSAISLLMLPWMSRRHAEAGPRALLRTALRAGLLLLALGVPYALVVVYFVRELFRVVYPGTAYMQAHTLLDLLLPATLLGAVSGPASMALYAQQMPRSVLWIKGLAAAEMCLVGTPLILKYGLRGAAWAVLLAALTEALSSAWLLAHSLNRRSQAP